MTDTLAMIAQDAPPPAQQVAVLQPTAITVTPVRPASPPPLLELGVVAAVGLFLACMLRGET